METQNTRFTIDGREFYPGQPVIVSMGTESYPGTVIKPSDDLEGIIHVDFGSQGQWGVMVEKVEVAA